MSAPADSLAILPANGARTVWMPFECAQTAFGGWPLTLVRAVHAPWELRIVRVDGDGVCRGVRLTGPALAGPALTGPALAGPALAGPAPAGPAPAGPALADDGTDATELHQGIDLCTARGSAGEDHVELRLLVPWDGEITLEETTLDGHAATMPQAFVHDLPCGYPVVVALRHSADPPAMPHVEQHGVGEDGRPLRIRSTGSSIPEIELAPDGDGDGGHAIAVTWPDNAREVIEVPVHPQR